MDDGGWEDDPDPALGTADWPTGHLLGGNPRYSSPGAFWLHQALWAWTYPGSWAVPRFDNWSDVFRTAVQPIGDQPVILIMDEFSYAAESDSALPSNL